LQKPVSDGRVAEAIRETLERDFGRTPASAIDFHARSELALTAPEEYTSILLSIFGSGTGYLLTAIISGLGERFGVDVTEGTTLDELVESLKMSTA
jgi:hypothetical protein